MYQLLLFECFSEMGPSRTVLGKCLDRG
jgi:hypothetical protein